MFKMSVKDPDMTRKSFKIYLKYLRELKKEGIISKQEFDNEFSKASNQWAYIEALNSECPAETRTRIKVEQYIERIYTELIISGKFDNAWKIDRCVGDKLYEMKELGIIDEELYAHGLLVNAQYYETIERNACWRNN